jgi:hypothetical protein
MYQALIGLSVAVRADAEHFNILIVTDTDDRPIQLLLGALALFANQAQQYIDSALAFGWSQAIDLVDHQQVGLEAAEHLGAHLSRRFQFAFEAIGCSVVAVQHAIINTNGQRSTDSIACTRGCVHHDCTWH